MKVALNVGRIRVVGDAPQINAIQYEGARFGVGGVSVSAASAVDRRKIELVDARLPPRHRDAVKSISASRLPEC